MSRAQLRSVSIVASLILNLGSTSLNASGSLYFMFLGIAVAVHSGCCGYCCFEAINYFHVNKTAETVVDVVTTILLEINAMNIADLVALRLRQS